MEWSKRRELGSILIDHPDGTIFSGIAFRSSAAEVAGACDCNPIDVRVKVEDGEYEPWESVVPPVMEDKLFDDMSSSQVGTIFMYHSTCFIILRTAVSLRPDDDSYCRYCTS